MITLETVRSMTARLPGAVEGTSYGTPAFKVGKKLFARFHQSERRDRADAGERR